MFHWCFALGIDIPLCQTQWKALIYHFTNLVEEEVIDVISEEGSELALLGLARPHVHLYLLNEPGQNSEDKQTLEQLGYTNIRTPPVNRG